MNPIEELKEDRDTARRLSDPNADVCFLATVDEAGNPQVRTLVLREIDGRSLGIFLNRTSPKWAELDDRGSYQLLLYYPTVLRQYRLSGEIQVMDTDTVAASWQLRPDGSKFMDHYYRTVQSQSTPLVSRQTLIEGIADLRRRLPPVSDLTPPAHAMGLNLMIDRIDRLDLTDPDRIHDRRLFEFRDDTWTEQYLVP